MTFEAEKILLDILLNISSTLIEIEKDLRELRKDKK